MGLIKRLSKGLKLLTNEMTKPDSFVKGEDFEEYVRKTLFPSSNFQLVHKTHDYNSNSRDYIESSLLPDFKFRDMKNGKEFYVEVKWRRGQYNREDKITWCNPNQLKRYKSIDRNESKVFIALGLGVKPLRPDEIALFPVSGCNFCDLYGSFIKKYSFYVNKPVFSGYLWKLK